MTFNRLCSKLILFSSVVVLGACSPKQESSTVQLKFPDWDQVRAKDLARQSKVSSLALPEANLHLISVNVTGPGMAPLIFHWEHENGAPRPEVVQFPNVPRGNDRLVQVLAIYENEGSMAFYYGDQKLNITSDIANADVEVVNEAVAQSLVEGRIAGRFLSSANEGYTGVVQLRFNPPSGAPAMVAANSEFFSGWGELFALSSPLISFTRPDGSKIFEGLTNDTHSFFNAQNMARAVRIHLPGGYENKSHSNGTYDMHPVKQQRLLVGYFGYYDNTTDSSQRVCVPAPATVGLAQDVDDRYKTANPADPSAAPSNPIKWLGRHVAGRISTDHAYVEAVLPPGGTLAMGGDESVSCSTDPTKKYSEFLDLTGTNLDHGDEMLGIRGPYGKHPDVDSNSSSVVLTEFDDAANKVVLSWKYLPGAANALAGSSVFYRSKPGYDVWNDGDLRADDGFRCNALSKLGFTEIPVGQGVETAEIPNIQDSTQASGLQILLCPKGQHGLFFQGAAPAQYWSGGGGGGVATKFELVGPDGESDNFKFTNNTCSPIRILGLSASNQKAGFPTGAQLSFNATVGSYSFYDKPDCTGGVLPLPMDLTGKWGDLTVFVKRTTAGPTSATLQASDLSAQIQPKTVTTHFMDDPGANKIKLLAPVSIVAHRCYPLEMQTRFIDATPTDRIAKHSGDTVSFVLPSVPGLSFYDGNDWNCAGTALSLSGAGVLGADGGTVITSRRLNFKYIGSAGFSILPTTGNSTFAGNVLGVNYSSAQITQPGSISNFQVMGDNQAQPNSCVRMTVGFYDSNQNPALVTSGTNGGAAVSVTLATDPGGQGSFFTNQSDCSANVNSTGSASISVGQPSATIYFKPSVAGTMVRVKANSVSPAKTSSFDINVGPEVATHLEILMSGQSLVAGTVMGPQPTIVKDLNFPIEIKAVRTDGAIDATYDGQLMSLSGGGNFSLVTMGPINFVNGSATAIVVFNAQASGATINASAQKNGTNISGGTAPFYVEPNVPGTPMIRLLTFNTWVTQDRCEPLLITFNHPAIDMGGGNFGAGSIRAPAITVTLSDSGPGATFYEDPDCLSQSSIIAIAAGTRAKLIGVKYNSMSFTSLSAAAAGFSTGTLGIGSIHAPTMRNSAIGIYHLDYSATSTWITNMFVGTCQPLAVMLNDGQGSTTYASPVVVNTSSPIMDFYTSETCTGAPVANVTIPTGKTSVLYYGRAKSIGTNVSSLTPSNNAGLTPNNPSSPLQIF